MGTRTTLSGLMKHPLIVSSLIVTKMYLGGQLYDNEDIKTTVVSKSCGIFLGLNFESDLTIR